MKKKRFITQWLIFFSHFTESMRLSWQSSKFLFISRTIFEILTIVTPILLSYFFKLIVNLFALMSAEDSQVLNSFLVLMGSVIVIRIVSVFFDGIKKILTDNHNQLINYRIDIMILRKINELDISYFDNPNYHNELNNVYKNGESLQQLAFMVITVGRSLVQLATCSIILFKVDYSIPVIVVLLTLPAVFLDNYVIKRRYAWERASTLERRKINYIKGVLNGQAYAKDVRIFHTQDYLFEKHNSLWNEWFDEKKSVYRKGTLISAIAQIIPHMTVYGILFMIGFQIIEGELTIGDFTFYNGIIIQFVSAITSLFASINRSYESEQRLNDFYKFMALESHLNKSGTVWINNIEKIEFRDVYFSYPNTNRYVLEDLSFTINSKMVVALVGENGAGKSTIIKLLLKLYEPTKGSILINDININDIDTFSLHKTIGVVFQDFNTYELTIREMISMSDIARKDDIDGILSACVKSGIDLQNNDFSNGLDTYIGKTFTSDGIILSGGQKQKLAIASCYFKNGSYYIMDEPNSALDPIAENELLCKLENLALTNGALLITHKLSAMKITDDIIVLQNGKVAERGSHNDLMQKDGIYKRMYVAQASKYIT